MPFASNADLPSRVRRLSDHDQTVYRKAFNSAFDGTCKDGGRQGDREGCSFAVAAAAVRKGEPVNKLQELVREIRLEALEATPFVAAEMEKAFGHLENAEHGGAPCPRGQHRDEKTGECRKANAGEMREAAAQRKTVGWVVPLVKVDEERRLVASVVYEPNVADAHDDAMTPVEIEKSCHNFGIRYAQGRGELGTDHARKANRLEVVPVESFLAPVDFHLGEQLVTKGSWVMWSKVLDDEIWKGIKAGEYTGYSFEGWGRRIPA